jgi:hypothetical protein
MTFLGVANEINHSSNAKISNLFDIFKFHLTCLFGLLTRRGMMNKYLVIMSTIFIFMLCGVLPLSSQEPIERGINWLYLHQNPDYSWGDSLDIVNTYHATTAVLNAFWALGVEDNHD